jgi:hypothetical protein
MLWMDFPAQTRSHVHATINLFQSMTHLTEIIQEEE